MNLPLRLRVSTLEERNRFYTNFNIGKATQWIGRAVVYAMILGKHSNIYPKQYDKDKKIPLIIDNYDSLKEVKKKIIHFLPEGVYYDRNYYKDISLCHSKNLKNVWDWDNFDGQELAFDLDPENINCPIHGSLQERMEKGWGLSFCKTAFELIKKNTFTLFEELNQQYNDVRIVFSGRGFHIHVFDESVRNKNLQERKEIAETYNKYGIDKWVTTGEMRLIRLPYSLNGFSSRIVMPIKKTELKDFDPSIQAVPKFISD